MRASLSERFPVVALGTVCITALTLRRVGLGERPMPFDWIGTSPSMIRHCLETDFSVLLDRTQYRSLTGSRPPNEPHEGCAHEFYAREFGIRPVFNHSDPTRTADYRYMTSCVERFREITASGEPKLFVQMQEINGESRLDFEATCTLLDELMAGAVFLQIAVSPPQNMRPLPKLEVMSVRGSHALYQMTPTSLVGGQKFSRTVDDDTAAALILDFGRHSPYAFMPGDHVTPRPSDELDASLARVRVVAHIADRGDTDADESGWTGACDSGLAIQGLVIRTGDAIAPASVAYQVALAPDAFSDWVDAGNYLGTRGVGQPVYGIRLSFAEDLLLRFKVSVELSFVDGTRLGPICQRRHYEFASGFPLEAIRILAVEDDNARPVSDGVSGLRMQAGALP